MDFWNIICKLRQDQETYPDDDANEAMKSLLRRNG